MIAVASVILVITPISWILLHQPQNDQADASIPIVTRTDDTYITPTTKPVVAPPTPTATPTVPPSATPTPSESATPSTTPSTTDRPTASPTEGRTTTDPTATPDDRPTTTSPSKPPTTSAPPPPPADDGSMTSAELDLFNRINSARTSNGCAPLKRDTDLTESARSSAGQHATSGNGLNSSSSTSASAGGDNWSSEKAFDKMMSDYRSTILNCGLTTLGVGAREATYSPGLCIPIFCAHKTRSAWVAQFS